MDDLKSGSQHFHVLEFFLRELGPPVYNQGVRDASGFMQEKLGDIEGEIYERETEP